MLLASSYQALMPFPSRNRQRLRELRVDEHRVGQRKRAVSVDVAQVVRSRYRLGQRRAHAEHVGQRHGPIAVDVACQQPEPDRAAAAGSAIGRRSVADRHRHVLGVGRTGQRTVISLPLNVGTPAVPGPAMTAASPLVTALSNVSTTK